MMGLLTRPELFSLIFEVRTLIFGTDGLYLYVDRGINFHKDLKRLHFDRFFMDHPLRFSRYNDWASVGDLVVLLCTLPCLLVIFTVKYTLNSFSVDHSF